MNTILIHLKRNKNQVKDVANKYLLKLAERHCKAFKGKKCFSLSTVLILKSYQNLIIKITATQNNYKYLFKKKSHILSRTQGRGKVFSFIGNSTLRDLRIGNAHCATDVWTPIESRQFHWLMARRHLWRNDVVSSYWRTPAIHSSDSLPSWSGPHYPSLLRFSGPTYLLRSSIFLRRLPQWNFVLLAVKWPWNIAVVNRRARDSSLAMTRTDK